MEDGVELLARLVSDHDWSEDEGGGGTGATTLGTQSCQHWTAWGELVDGDIAETPIEATDRQLAIALRLLPFTGTPSSWIQLANYIPALPSELRGEAVRTLIASLNLRFAELLTSDPTTREQARHLIYTFEAINFLEDWCITVDGDYNYIPQFGIEHWFGRFMDVVNAHCTPDDLQMLTQRTEDEISIPEALSTVVDPQRLLAIAAASPELGAILAQAPNLPPSFVNEHISESEYLIFHPQADVSAAWSALEELLSSSPDDAIQLMAPMDNLRDQGWGTVMGYPESGRNAEALRARTRQWCLENPDEGEDLLFAVFGD